MKEIKPSMLKINAILRVIEKKGFKIVFLLRLAPILPFNILNYALGASNVKTSEYLLGSIGALPKLCFFVYISVSVPSLSEAINKENNNIIALAIIISTGIIIGFATCVYITIVSKKEINKIIEESKALIPEEEIKANRSINE